MSNPSLSDDLVPDWAGIALLLFKKDDPSTIRKCRNLADRHGMPVHRKGRYCWAFRSQLDRWARGEPEHGAAKLTCARLDGAGTNGTQLAAEQDTRQ
jgi:hypothetical protein